MKKYRLLVNGRNFLFEVGGKPAKCGFYQMLFLEAASPVLAEQMAVEQVRDDKALLKVARNSKEDPPTIHIEEIEELVDFPNGFRKEPGHFLYEETEPET